MGVLFYVSAATLESTDNAVHRDYDKGTVMIARFKIITVVASAIAVAALIFAWGRPALTSRAVSPHSVTLTWKASPGASFYYVYRSDISGSHYQKIASAPTNTFKDSPVPSKAVFYYVVTAVSGGRESGYSKEIKVVVP
jgi:hypothetical protein